MNGTICHQQQYLFPLVRSNSKHWQFILIEQSYAIFSHKIRNAAGKSKENLLSSCQYTSLPGGFLCERFVKGLIAKGLKF